MSKEILGVFVAVAGVVVGSFGFSEGCTNEIVAQAMPLVAALPGLLTTYFARVSRGDVSYSGRRLY